jgi:hypothetical protein
MFDTQQEIDLTLPSPEGDKSVTVRFPTDDELTERVRKMTLTVRSLGRGKTQTEAQPSHTNDLLLLNKIKVSGDELDEYEASQVIGRLVRCKVEDSKRDGKHFSVTLKVLGATTVHTLKIPSAKQCHTYSRAAVSVIEGRHGLQEMRLNPGASQELYDAVLVKTDGYVANCVPLPHKEAVISEVMALLNSIQEDADVEGF